MYIHIYIYIYLYIYIHIYVYIHYIYICRKILFVELVAVLTLFNFEKRFSKIAFVAAANKVIL